MVPSTVQSAPAIELGPHREVVLIFYYSVLVLGAQVGLPLVLATAFFGRNQPRRHPAFINIVIAWLVYGISALFLLYEGQGIKTQQRPGFGLCLTQAALIYAGSAAVGMTNIALVVQLWLEFRGSRYAKGSRGALLSLVVTPWIVFLGFFVFTMTLGLRDPSLVSIQWTFYCTLSSPILVDVVSGVSMASLFVVFLFEVAIIRMLVKSSLQFRTANRTSYYLAIRVTVFASYSLVTFVVYTIMTMHPTLIFPYLFLATLPLAAFLIFGTQKENIQLWTKYCLRRRKAGRINALPPIVFKPGRISASTTSSSSPSAYNVEKRLPPTPKSGSTIV
ncbi:hypothetical protein SCHPADRAFT_940095 [Schizopora paradoxa]|uniref:G-protein coupled receptors family 1 profile domain-containing protein n=1 Tax=Schizopora paradoxa TaxID=27342 RepID=A0A0H2RQ61_9AGAM|nr:hypothetical protein SCHPADRAFT_940095 [Schizopora paradoxa]